MVLLAKLSQILQEKTLVPCPVHSSTECCCYQVQLFLAKPLSPPTLWIPWGWGLHSFICSLIHPTTSHWSSTVSKAMPSPVSTHLPRPSTVRPRLTHFLLRALAFHCALCLEISSPYNFKACFLTIFSLLHCYAFSGLFLKYPKQSSAV